MINHNLKMPRGAFPTPGKVHLVRRPIVTFDPNFDIVIWPCEVKHVPSGTADCGQTLNGERDLMVVIRNASVEVPDFNGYFGYLFFAAAAIPRDDRRHDAYARIVRRSLRPMGRAAESSFFANDS